MFFSSESTFDEVRGTNKKYKIAAFAAILYFLFCLEEIFDASDGT